MIVERRTQLSQNTERSRYEITRADQVIGVLDYRDEGAIVVLPHTYIDPSARGRGLAAKLVRFALDDLRAKQRSIDPQCWFVAQFIATHADYQDLVAPAS